LEALRVLKELPRDALDGSWSELRDSRSKLRARVRVFTHMDKEFMGG